MMKRLSLMLILCACGATCVAVPAFAQSKKPPVEIEADTQLEWLRSKNMYRGTGNVTITQGTTVIRGDKAEAHYDAATGPSSLTIMTVDGHVVITDMDRVIHADHGTYDARTQIVVLTGEIITLTTPTMSVTSHDAMEYHAADNKAIARGKAEVTQPGQKLTADTVTAWLEQGTNKLDHAEAVGHVVITKDNKNGEKDIAQAQRGLYNATKNNAELFGDVRMTQGANHMEGDHATIDLTTGYSTLTSTPGKGKDGKAKGRVRAIFTAGKNAPMPQITTTMPTIKAKKELEQPYAVGVKQHEKQ